MSAADPRSVGARRLPLLSIAFVLCALITELSGAGAWLSFERGAIQRGELWRLLTAHLVHDAARLALLDLATFVLFGAWIELASRALWSAVLVASALVSSLAVLSLTHYERYVGSSALVSGLLVAAAVLLLRSSRGALARLAGGTLVVLFVAKVVLESLGAWPAALGGLPPGYEPVAVAHITGALAGASVAAAWSLERSPR